MQVGNTCFGLEAVLVAAAVGILGSVVAAVVELRLAEQQVQQG
jgi:hypothetical protein